MKAHFQKIFGRNRKTRKGGSQRVLRGDTGEPRVSSETKKCEESSSLRGEKVSKEFTLATDSIYSVGDVDHCGASVMDSSADPGVEHSPARPTSRMEMKRQIEQQQAERGLLEEAPQVVKAYEMIPVLEQTKLPRGGVSVETKAVGRVQVS